MLKRIYADNYRCFVDFEFIPGRQALLLGGRATGRTSLLELLQRLEWLVLGLGEKAPGIWDIFWSEDYGKWHRNAPLVVEVEFESQGDQFTYHVEVSYGLTEDETRLVCEAVTCNGNKLFTFMHGIGRLYDENEPIGDEYESDAEHAVFCRVLAAEDDSRLQRFRRWWQELWIILRDPRDSLPATGESVGPGSSFYEFVSWYRYMSRMDVQRISSLNNALGALLPGFETLRLSDHQTQSLQAVYRNSLGGSSLVHGLDYLADSERTIIQLHALVHLGLQDDRVMIIDAPAATLNQDDLYSWYQSMLDVARKTTAQVLLVVNDQSLVERLSADAVYHFEREQAGPSFVTTTQGQSTTNP